MHGAVFVLQMSLRPVHPEYPQKEKPGGVTLEAAMGVAVGAAVGAPRSRGSSNRREPVWPSVTVTQQSRW